MNSTTRRLSAQVLRPVLRGFATLPLALAAAPMTLAGFGGAAARAQRAVLHGSAPPDGRVRPARVLAYSVVVLPSAALTFGCAALFGYLCSAGHLYPLRPDTVHALGHPFSADPGLDGAWGGPTLVGAWLVHSLVAAALQAACLLVLHPVQAFQARTAHQLLRTRPTTAVGRDTG